MKFVDFNDETIPIGKRKSAYVQWAIKQGTDPIKAKQWANKKFGFERKGKFLVKVGNASFMDYPSFRNTTWEDICGVDCRKAESVVIVCDEYYAPFDICKGGLLSTNTLFGNLPNGWEDADDWAKENGYKVSIQWLWS